MSSNYQQKKMMNALGAIDTKGNIVLEQFQDGTALLFQPGNVQSVIMGDSRLWERPLDRDFRDNMIASGNDDLDARVTILKENGNFKNVDTAIPVTSLEELEHHSVGLSDKAATARDGSAARYEFDMDEKEFDRPCEVLDTDLPADF